MHTKEDRWSVRVRLASPNESDRLGDLIAESLRVLGSGFYTPEQIEGMLCGACAVDSQLILDRTYFVAEVDGELAGCGGWSWRTTLFGGDEASVRDDTALDPDKDAAKIRAFFVRPEYARRGVGRALLDRCETAAFEAGFRTLELMSTLSGLDFYISRGYEVGESILHALPNGASVTFVPMRKSIMT